MDENVDENVVDDNLVEIWLRKDKARWLAGAIAGLFAGLVMLAFAMVLCSVIGMEPLFPIKFAALPILGNGATEYGFNIPALVIGLLTTETLCVVLGVLYAHFTGTNFLPALLGMGLVWGSFSWIFINNLFSQSFRPVSAAGISRSAMFFVWMVFGLALTSVAFFDRMVRAKKV